MAEDENQEILERGYLYFYRAWFKTPCFLDSDLWKVFCWMWFKANHKDQWVSLKVGRGETQVEVKRGQFISGRLKAAKELRMKPASFYKRLRKLEKLQKCSIKSSSHYSIISVCNYDILQKQKKPKEQAKEQARSSQGAQTINDGSMGIKKEGATLNSIANEARANSEDRLGNPPFFLPPKTHGNDKKNDMVVKETTDGNGQGKEEWVAATPKEPRTPYLSETCPSCNRKISGADLDKHGACFRCSTRIRL